MGNWLDNIQQLTSFKPYTSQVPVDAVMKTGMELQRRYEEGVEKIQSSIDRVAGLDIVRDVDRQYLQSKLNGLGSNLKTVAGGDFSDSQLVNSLAGMATKISKDPTVMTAVKSTAWYRKQSELLQKDNESGKSNPANTYHFNRRVNSWLSSQTEGEPFSDSYFTPRDVWGKLKEVAAQVGIDASDIMQLYQTDELGNILYEKDPKTGTNVAKWNPVMAEKILKGKDAGKILTAFQNSLTSADFQQLNIEGEYQLAESSPEMLKNTLSNQAAEQLSSIKDKVDNLNSDLDKENLKNERDSDRITSLNKQIEFYDKQKIQIENTLEKSLGVVDKNPDAVRGAIYTNKYLSNMAKVLSSQDISTKYSISPMWEITMDQNRLNSYIQRENQRHAEWAADFGLKNQQFDLEKLKLKLEYDKTSGLGFVNEPISDEERKDIPLNVESNYQSQIAERDGLAKQITIEYYKRLNPRTTGETNIVYNDRLNRLIEQKAGEEDLQSYYNRIASQESSNKGSVNPVDKDILKQYENAVRLTNFQKDEIEATKAEAREIAKRQGLTVPTDEEIKGSTSGLTVRVGEFRDKRDVNLSPQDLMDFISLHPEAMNKFGPVYLDFPGKEQRGKKEEAKLRLQQKYGKDFDQIHYSLFQPNMFGQFTKIHPEIAKMVGNLNSSEYKKLKEIEADLYIKNGTIQQPKSFAILAGKEKETDVQAKISNVIEVYKNLKPEEIRKALGENKNAARITGYPQQDGTSKYVLQITGVDGKEGAPLEIDAEKFEYIMGTPPPTSMQKPMVISMLDRHGTTNMSKTVNPETAFFKPDDFVNFNDPNYMLKGDLVNVTGNSDKVYLYLYLYDKGGNYIRTITYPDPKDEGSRLTKYNNDRSYNISLQYAPIGITSEVIKQLTKSK